VVDHDAEVVDRRAVRPLDDEIVELAVLEDDASLHLVVDDGLAVDGGAKAQDVAGATRGRRREIATGPVVPGTLAGRGGALAPRIDLLGRAPAAIRVALGEQSLGRGAVQ